MNFIDILTIASTALAATATVFAAITTVRSARQTSRAQETVRTVELRSAIEELDRSALRRVLYSELGSVRVSDYVSDQKLRSRFDELIAEVAHFVAEPEHPEAPLAQEETAPLRTDEEVPPELAAAYRDLVAGDSWAALARLRRTLELRLASMLGDELPATRGARGVGQQLRRLRSMGRIDDHWYRQLEYATSVCNAAVHGEDVPASQAAEVFDIVSRWMATAP